MELYVQWWQPQNQGQLALSAPFLNLGLAVFYPPDSNWLLGYYRLDQMLTEEQFNTVDALANSHVAINCVRGPYPPYSPTGR